MKHSIRSKTAVTLWLSGAFLLLWLLFSVLMTIILARYIQEIRGTDHQTNGYVSYLTDRWFDETGGFDYGLYSDFKTECKCHHNDTFPERCQRASVLTDTQGNVLVQTDTRFFFHYHTAESWASGADLERDGAAQVLFKMELIPKEIRDNFDHFVTFHCFAMRFTGVMDSGSMQPSRIEYVEYDEFRERELTHYSGEYSYVVSQEIQRFDLPWHTLYEDPSVEGDVTIYTSSPRVSIYDAGGPVKYEGATYETLLALLLTGKTDARKESLFHCLRIREQEVYDEETMELIGYFRTATSFSPILTAMESLMKTYLYTFLLALVLFLIVRRVLVLNLVIPMRAVNEAADQDWKYLIYHNDHGAVWREAVELEKHYNEARDHRIRSNDEIFRLNAALEYAKTAEENRRQMTSAIAHELKTPLAVIHSYAEGLKAHIAEEKRDRYLDVIMSEAENLDAMVLEMLDLSRLEAGRVKLTREPFSLSALTAEIFEKLSLTAEEKNLRIELNLSGDCVINADEGRIGQVITNFASNAIRYTPQDGRVQVKVFDDRNYVWLLVENESHPFSDEELSKIWETFYRADKSRSGKGTGLGLAICKSIIDLHGGICKAQNTRTGVEFQFRLKK